MARYTNAQVAHRFAHKQDGDSNNLHSDGVTLKSYDTVIAFWQDDVCFVSSNGMTVTTSSKHLSPLHSALYGFRSFYSPAFSTRHTPNVTECITAKAEELVETFKGLHRKRSNLEWAIQDYERRRADAIEIAARFNVTIPELPEATGDLKAKAVQIAAQEQEQRQEQERREQERQEQQRRDDAARFNEWLSGVPVQFPSSYRRSVTGTDYIKVSISGDKVVTSQGAEAPLSHVRRAIAFYLSRRIWCSNDLNLVTTDNSVAEIWATGTQLTLTFTPYHTNGHKIPLGVFTLDSIDEHGNVKAGCHYFTAAEIARFIEQWNEVLK